MGHTPHTTPTRKTWHSVESDCEPFLQYPPPPKKRIMHASEFTSCSRTENILQSSLTILNILEIFGCLMFAIQFKGQLWFQGWRTPKSLFQNQWDTSAPLLYALQTSEAIFKTGFLSAYARGYNPSSLPPQVRQYGQFSHISTCIILCTSHNWSMTVTSCIRCFSIYFLHRFYAINVT